MIQDWFVTSVLVDMCPEINVSELEQYCYSLKKANRGRVVTNYGGWQSEDLDQSEPVLQELVSKIYQCCYSMHEYHSVNKRYEPLLDNIWFNVNGAGSFNRPHIHPDALFSGCFYIKTPENCGNIIFTHPAQHHQYHFREDIEIVSDWTTKNSGIMFQKAQSGKIVMFPSFANHYVEPNMSGQDRISIAFNLKLNDKG